MSGVFAASLQAAVWKSRVPQKWFNPNYPVSSVCFRPVSSPLVPSCCNLLSVDIYLQCNICCSELWNMESASVRNNLFSKHATIILMRATRVRSVETELEYCWKLCHPQRPVTMLQCHGQMSRRLQQLPCPNCKCAAAIVYRLIADIQLRNSILIMTMIYTINSV